MWDYIKFWLAKDVAELVITIAALCALILLAVVAQRKDRESH
jgi:hypothetical protein